VDAQSSGRTLSLSQQFEHIADNVRTGAFGGQQIAGNCVVASREECVSDDAGKFTGD